VGYINRLIAGEISTFSMEKRYIRKDGTIVWVNLTISLIYGLSGQPQYFIGVIEDISERKHAEELLKEQKEFSENLVQNSAVPTFVIDSQHKVIIWNKACEDLAGIPASQVLGTSDHWKVFYKEKRPCISDIVLDGKIDNLPEYYSTSAKSNILSEGLHGEAWFSNLNGGSRYLVLDAAPIRNSKGELIAVIETLHDFTEWKQAEEVIFYEQQRVHNELQLASSIQTSLTPIKLPQVPGLSIACTTQAAREVGGDYCDLLINRNKNLGIAICDVMGIGVPAALFVSMTYTFVRENAVNCDTPNELVNKLNEHLFPQLEYSGQFITFIYAIYDPATRELVYTNAGHNQPIVYRAQTGRWLKRMQER